MSVPLRLALIGLALVGAACASTAPTPLRLPPSSPRAAPAPAPTPPAQIVVQRGDTLITIARRGGVETAALARANGLAPPYRLRVGQVLTLPPGRAGTAGRFAPSPGDAQSLAVPAVPAAPVEAAALPPLAPRERLPAVELDLSEEALPPISPRPDARTAGGGTAGEARAPERDRLLQSGERLRRRGGPHCLITEANLTVQLHAHHHSGHLRFARARDYLRRAKREQRGLGGLLHSPGG